MALPLALLVLAPGLGAGSAEDLASRFLDAWVYRDVDQMWALLDDASRQGLTPESLAAALDVLPLLPERSEIVGSQPEGEVVRVRFRLHGHHRTSGVEMTQPGTLVITSLGGPDPRISFRLPQSGSVPGSVAAAAGRATSLPPSQVIDGLTAQDILDRAAARHGQIETLRAELSLHGAMMGDSVDMRGELLFAAPNRLRLDLGQVLFVFDGLGGTCYLPEAFAYFPLPAEMSQDLMGFTPGLGGPMQDVQASLIAREDVGGHAAYHLALAGPPGSSAGAVGPMHVWLDVETLLPRRAQGGAAGMAMDLVFDSVTVNPGPIPAEAFAFDPPPEAMEIPLMLPGFGGVTGS